MSEYKIIEPDKGRWNNFVESNPKCNIFQTYDIKEVYDKAKNYNTLLLAIEKDNKIVAGALVEIRKEKKWPLSYFSTRAVIEGGPIYTEKEAVSVLLKELEKRLKNKVIYVHVFNENFCDDIKNIMKDAGYQYEDELNFLMDLNRNHEDIWKEINKSRRKGIKRAKNNGVVIRKIKDEKDLHEFYRLVKKTYSRIKVPVSDYSLIKACFEILGKKEMVDFYLADYKGDSIGARAVIKYKDVVYDWSAGSSEKHFDKYPNEALVWHVLENNAKRFRIFDFQGAGKPGQNYGPGEFKRRFGGKEVNFGRFKKILCPIRNKIAMFGLRIYQRGVTNG